MSGDAAFRSINTDVKYSLPKSWEYRRSCAQLNRRFSLPRTRSRSLVRFAPYTLNFKFWRALTRPDSGQLIQEVRLSLLFGVV